MTEPQAAVEAAEEEVAPAVVATRRIRWAYNPDLDLIGTEEDVPAVEARNLVWEGRASYVDESQYATGGFVESPEPGGSDAIPPHLADPGYLLPASVVREAYPAALDALNQPDEAAVAEAGAGESAAASAPAGDTRARKQRGTAE